MLPLNSVLGLERDLNDKLPSVAWPGAYPLVYYTKHGDVLCADCATNDLDQWCDADWRGPGYHGSSTDGWYDGPQWAHVLFETEDGQGIDCDQCNTTIKGAYDEA